MIKHLIQTILFGLAITCAPLVCGQTSNPSPKFEVVTIKRCKQDVGISSPIGSIPGRVKLDCRSVMSLIRQSYVLFANGKMNAPGRLVPVEQGPAWMESDLYTIEAKAEGSPSLGTMLGPMMQALLEQRFKLQMHSESREVPVYELSVARIGPKLQHSQTGSCISPEAGMPPPAPVQPLPPICKMARITNTGFDLRGATIAELCSTLSGKLDRDVIDKTGVTGIFDFQLQLDPAVSGRPTLAPPPPPPGAIDPTSATAPPDQDEIRAVVRNAVQKFGLKLEPAKGLGRFFVVDHVEKPSEN